MAFRSRTPEFRNARRTKTLYRHNKSDSMIDLEYAHEDGLGDHIIDLSQSQTRAFGLLPVPPWMSKQLTNIQNQLDDIRLNMDKLGNMHNELPSFNQSGSSTHSEIEEFTTLLTTKFTKCNASIKSFGTNIGPVGHSADKFLSSIRTHRMSMLQSLGTEFERCQQQYLQNVMGQIKSSKYFDYKDEDSSSDSGDYLKNYSTASQQQMMHNQDRRMIHERDKQVKQLAKSIADITALYQDMAEMVVAQGTILDRIDHNITSASEHVAQAVIELDEADKLEFSSGKCLLIFLIIILLFTGTVLVALWSKRRNE